MTTDSTGEVADEITPLDEEGRKEGRLLRLQIAAAAALPRSLSWPWALLRGGLIPKAMHARVYRDAARPEGGHLWHAKLRPAQCSHVHPSPYKICCYACPLCESACMYGLLSLASICSSLAEEARAFKAKCHLERGLKA